MIIAEVNAVRKLIWIGGAVTGRPGGTRECVLDGESYGSVRLVDPASGTGTPSRVLWLYLEAPSFPLEAALRSSLKRGTPRLELKCAQENLLSVQVEWISTYLQLSGRIHQPTVDRHGFYEAALDGVPLGTVEAYDAVCTDGVPRLTITCPEFVEEEIVRLLQAGHSVQIVQVR